MPQLICKTYCKVSHRSQNEAKIALRSLKITYGYSGGIYACSFCRSFHVGRIIKKIDRVNRIKKLKKEIKRFKSRSFITIYISRPPEDTNINQEEIRLHLRMI